MVRLSIDASAFVDAKDKSRMDAFGICASLAGKNSSKASVWMDDVPDRRTASFKVSQCLEVISNDQANMDRLDITAS